MNALHLKSTIGFGAFLLTATAAVAQPGPVMPVNLPPPAVKSAQARPRQPAAPANPDYAPPASEAAPAPAPAPLPPAIWDPANVQALVAYIGQVGREGLDPDDYDAGGLTAALGTGNPVVLSKAATDRFNKLSWDL